MSTTTNLGMTLLDGGLRQPETVINADLQILDSVLAGVYPRALITEDLIAFWPLNEPSGTRYDLVGANNLTDNNTVTQAEGKRSPSAQFTLANSESLSIADNTDLSTGNIEFSGVFWVYLDAKATSQDLVSKWGASGQFEYIVNYQQSTDRFRFTVSGDGTATTTVSATTFGSPTVSTWYMIHYYHDPATNLIGISVNNGTIDTAAHSTGVFNSTAGFYIGARSGGTPDFFGGRIQMVRFFKRMLTADELTYLYNSGKSHPVYLA